MKRNSAPHLWVLLVIEVPDSGKPTPLIPLEGRERERERELVNNNNNNNNIVIKIALVTRICFFHSEKRYRWFCKNLTY